MTDLFYLQDKRQYVGNDVLWWAKDGKGYTTDLSKAQTYSKEDAINQNKSRQTDVPWPKKYVDEKTRPAVDMQYIDIDIALKNTGIILAQPKKPRREQYNCGSCGKFVSEGEYYTRPYNGFPCRKCEDN
jgi:hypothetical protein